MVIHLEPVGRVVRRCAMEEDAVAGPGRLVPQPLRALPIAWRNVEALRRLAYVCERRP